MSGPGKALQGRCAIVTGAGKGLGRAYALHLAAQGAAVLVNNRRHAGEADPQTSAQQTVQAIEAAGGLAQASWCDVSDPGSGEQMVDQALACFGRIDMLVANAGCDAACSFAKQSMADFRAIFDVGFFGSLYLTHAAWPHLMQQSYGRVVLTTSSAGLYGNHGQSAYAASKAAVIGLMRSLALEGQRHNVLVNAIAPYAYSQMTAPYLAAELAPVFDVSRVAPLVSWLCQPDCQLNGELLVSGAGITRRAGVGESQARRLWPQDMAQGLSQLSALPLQGYASANASFAKFLTEVDSMSPSTT